MKKIIHQAIGLILLICCSIGVFFYCYLDARQLSCKIESIEHLNHTEELVVIKMSQAEYAAHSGKSEIWYQSALYDVKSVAIDGDSVEVTVWHDENEEGVQQQLVSSFDHTQQYQFPSKSIYFSSYHCFVPDGKIMPGYWYLNDHHLYSPVSVYPITGNAASISGIAYSVISPPPDCMLG